MSNYGYEVQGNPDDGVVYFLLKVGELKDDDGKVVQEELQSVGFIPGEVIPEKELAAHIPKKYEEGDEHVNKLLKRVTLGKEEAETDVAEQPADEPEAEPKPKSAAKKAPAKSQSVE